MNGIDKKELSDRDKIEIRKIYEELKLMLIDFNEKYMKKHE